MAQVGLKVQVDIREIFDALCPKCKKKVRALVKEKITDQLVDKVIGAEVLEPVEED